MSEIDRSNFITWKNDIVTKEIFKALKEIRVKINNALTNSDVLLGENAEKSVPRLVGQREGLDLILEIKFEDVGEEASED